MAQSLEKVLYTAAATAVGGREGRVTTDDGLLDLSLVPPKGLGGQGGGTNPEQLFASGYAACFGSAVAHLVSRSTSRSRSPSSRAKRPRRS